MTAIRVVVVDDHDLLREGVVACLQSRDGIEVVGMANSGPAAVKVTAELEPDVVVMDLIMPRGGGVAAIAELASSVPSARVLALTSFNDVKLARQAIAAGATGLQLKSVSGDELVSSIRLTASGQSAFDAEMLRRIATERDLMRELTKRERTIADHVAKGMSNAEIAQSLMLSVYTVKNHVSNILAKLQVHSRTELVALILNDRFEHPSEIPTAD